MDWLKMIQQSKKPEVKDVQSAQVQKSVEPSANVQNGGLPATVGAVAGGGNSKPNPLAALAAQTKANAATAGNKGNALAALSAATGAGKPSTPAAHNKPQADGGGPQELSLEALSGFLMDDIDAVPDEEDSPEISADEFNHDSQPDALSAAAVKELQDSLDVLRNNLDNLGLVQQNVVSIMKYVQEKPFLADIIAPEDIGLLVGGLRQMYGVTVTKKVTNSAKRTAKANDVDRLVGDLGLGNLLG